jgi:sugar phosphate isomerase/epimerase
MGPLLFLPVGGSMIDRRVFLGTLGAACAAGVRLDGARIPRIGMQLYTVRNQLEKDFNGTLAKVAAIGYKEVEFAGYFTRTPQQVREALKASGLVSPAAHVAYGLLTDKWEATLETARAIGHQFLVNPWLDESMRKSLDDWKRIAETFNRAGERSMKAGIQFAYHNHHFEFLPLEGRMPFDLLLEQCDPKLVTIELDLCWITVAGKDPLDYFKRYPGRFPLVHVKGLAKTPEGGAAAPFPQAIPNITDVGTTDIVDWKRIFARSNEAGIRHYFVEHDAANAPFESLKASYDYLTRLDF